MFDENILISKHFKYLEGVEEPLIPIILSKLLFQKKKLFFISENDKQMFEIKNFIYASQPDAEIILIPSWDTSPYDISSPNKEILGKRINSFTKILNNDFSKKKVLIITTYNALLIKNAPKNFFEKLFINLKVSSTFLTNEVKNILIKFGYKRVETVREMTEFSIRGDIFDIFVNGYDDPFRIYLFDNKIEKIFKFDPFTQRNLNYSNIDNFTIYSAREFFVESKNINLFKLKYSKNFDLDLKNDLFYNQIISGHIPEGIENYLELFHEDLLSNIFDLITNNNSLKNNLMTITYSSCMNFLETKSKEIKQNFNNRSLDKEVNILDPSKIFLKIESLKNYLNKLDVIYVNNYFEVNNNNFDFKSKKLILPSTINFSKSIKNNSLFKFFEHNLFKNKVVIIFIKEATKLKNLITFLEPFLNLKKIHFREININNVIEKKLVKGFYFCKSYIDYSIEIDDFFLISEHDLLGTSKNRYLKSRRKADAFLRDLGSLNHDDYIAHVDFGLGQYKSLEIINISGYKHDCLKIIYSGGDKLFIPVENINLLSKIGDSSEKIVLDKLGSSSWQIKKDKIKKKINDIAQKLINTAANRGLQSFEKIFEPKDYEQFVKGFDFALTDDQEIAINDVLNDIFSQKLMDRLICGDVGFGKTEIALRAAYVMASNGKQVALVAPTTILAEQHLNTFVSRFKNFNINIKSLSRLTNAKERPLVKKGLNNGDISIVIGTHSLLSKDISFNDLGLLIIDEEQHFGVSQKERLKELQFNIHVLTLTATPIPRTLQLSLSGLKDLSLITTPPVNRLSVRTFIQNWDKISISDALIREKKRNGQTFVVCPKIKDIDLVKTLIIEMVPQLKLSIAHGKLTVSELEKSVNDFYTHKTDILISTNIIESGIDIPNANTLIVYNSDLFGLSQLYQLRGRVGRSSTRAYAFFTYNKNKLLNEKSQERLKVLKTLDNLGAGFTLANYDLDLRGAGNILGDQQSGQIKEIGYELYQKMLKEAILSLKKGTKEIVETWSPNINLGMSVLIPDDYVKDLSIRMSLYRKAGELKNIKEIKDFEEELIERFGLIPIEVSNLIFTISLKIKCIQLNINFIDVGPKAILIGFKNDKFRSPEKLIEWISMNEKIVKLRKDQKLIIKYEKTNINKIGMLKKYINQIGRML